LKRLNVGVALDDWQKVDADGKVTTAPMSDADIKRFSQLVRESIGLKEDRGDQLNVLNQAFKSSAPLGPVDGSAAVGNTLDHAVGKTNRGRRAGAGGGVPGAAAIDEVADQAGAAAFRRR
jgi:hypothetical protein